MQTTATRYADELFKLIGQEYEKIQEYLAGGHLKDFSEYQRYVGMLIMLRAVKEMMEIAQTNSEKF